jgi:monovalent cation:H+ antiporter-2, CPA2 family
MEHTLIFTIIASIVSAYIFGVIAKYLRLPAIFGYLLAGVAIGPNTPGFVADITLAKQLAEIGIILLMFGVGLHFSFKDLLESRKIALPGAVVQMVSATLIGGAVGCYLGYGVIESYIFGFSLSVASTIVLIRSLEQRHLLDTQGGKIAISWLIVEDIVMVLALVMIPVIAEIHSGEVALSFTHIGLTALEVVLKIGAFVAFMIVVGRRLLPWLLVKTARLRSAELNTLCTLAIALGFALIAYEVFDASLALGAFLAGVMLNESDIGNKSADNSSQMRDAFSVLFFVSVGMLFDPSTLITQPLAVLLTFLTIVVAKSLAALAITSYFSLPRTVGYPVAIGLAQIGEFSFILGGLALTKGLIDQSLYNLILAGAMLSIVANPFLLRLMCKKAENPPAGTTP